MGSGGVKNNDGYKVFGLSSLVANQQWDVDGGEGILVSMQTCLPVRAQHMAKHQQASCL